MQVTGTETTPRRLPRLGVATRITLVVWLAVLLSGLDIRYLRTQPVYDVFLYQCYAHAFWQGTAAVAADPALTTCDQFWDGAAGAYHVLPREYPAPSLAVFSLPLLVPGGAYTHVFALMMAIVVVAAAALIAWRGPPGAAITFVLYCAVGGYGFVLERYDLAPGLLILLSLVAAGHRRYRVAATTLALGAALKLLPALLLPPLLIAIRRREGRWPIDCPLIFCAVLGLTLLPFALLSPAHILDPVHYALARPLHSESAPGLVYWLTGALGSGVRASESFSSCNLEGQHQGLFTGAGILLLLCGLAWTFLRQWRGSLSPGRSFLAVLTLVLVTGKVFSPQYIFWLLPTVAVYEGLRLRWLLACALIGLNFAMRPLCSVDLTSVLHPFAAPHGLAASSTLATLVLALRDVAFCAIALRYLFGPEAGHGTQWMRVLGWRNRSDPVPPRGSLRSYPPEVPLSRQHTL